MVGELLADTIVHVIRHFGMIFRRLCAQRAIKNSKTALERVPLLPVTALTTDTTVVHLITPTTSRTALDSARS